MRRALLLMLMSCAAPRVRVPLEQQAHHESMTATFDSFFVDARKIRATSTAGQSMPEALANAWSGLLDEADLFARGRHQLTDVSRVRLQLQTEFQTDAALFGDMPPGLAEHALLTIRELNQQLASIRAAEQEADPNAFIWPVQPTLVTSPYGDRIHPIAGEPRFHAGIDLECAEGHPVRAAADGVVAFADWNGGHGKQVEVTHDAHWVTRYSHLSQWLVTAGTRVKKGEVIGLSGQTGLATGPHLHFEIRRDGDALDPESLFTPQEKNR